jgi:ribonuclease HI
MPQEEEPTIGHEFIALWTLLNVAKEKDLRKLQVMGDSKLVIEWAQGRVNIQNIHLSNILRDIRLTFQDFEWLSFHHIPRELNSKADELSKEALELHSGTYAYYEYKEGVEAEAMEVRF